MSPNLRTAALLAILALVSACVSQPAPKKLRYAIGPERPGASATTNRADTLLVNRFNVSPLYEHKGFVYRTGDSTWASDYYNEFFDDPGVLLREATTGWLSDAGVFGSVVSTNLALGTNWHLEARVDKLYGDTRGSPRAVIVIEYALLDRTPGSSRTVLRKRYAAERPADDASAAGIVAGWNAGFAEILTQLEADLRASLPD